MVVSEWARRSRKAQLGSAGETASRYLILTIFKNCGRASAFGQDARAMRMSSTPGAAVNIPGRNHGGCARGAFRIVSFGDIRRSNTRSGAAPLGLEQAQRARPVALAAPNSSSPGGQK